MGLRWPLAALFSWTGYSAAGVIVTSLGAAARGLLGRKAGTGEGRSGIVWRCWNRAGLLGLGLISPVTIGPKGAALVGLALGERPGRLALAISLGALPWALGLALATAWGVSLFR